MRLKARWRLAGAALLFTSVIAAGIQGCSAAGETVTILVAFTAGEIQAFDDTVIRPFEKQDPGVSVNVESTRALTQEIAADDQQGTLPQLAALPSIGTVAQYRQDGYPLQPLSGVIDPREYGPPWSSLMRLSASGRGPVYTVPVKVDVKSLVWYDPAKSGGQMPHTATWPELLATAGPGGTTGRAQWCLALSSAPTSGWPGADWISDIMLSQQPPGNDGGYEEWAAGQLPWSSGSVRKAWDTWNQLIGASGALYAGPSPGATGAATALTEPVGTAGFNPAAPHGCSLSHGTLVDQGFSSKTDKYHADYAYVPFPASAAPLSRTPVQVSADFAVMFDPTPGAKALMRYMTQTSTQRAWAGEQDSAGGPSDTFSANNGVRLRDYPPGVTRDIASLLSSGRELCLSASDAMPPSLSAAFDNAVLAYIAAPKTLPSVLRQLDSLRTDLSRQEDAKAVSLPVCGTP